MTDPEDLLATLRRIQHHDLRILQFSESITAAFPADATRSSDISESLAPVATPATLQADLSHYKELFSKLRFSYLEQVTKEKFLRAITEDSPLVVEPGENEVLERRLLQVKGELRRSKREVEGILTDLEGLSRKLADGHWTVQECVSKATTLPQQSAEMEGEIARLAKEQNSASSELQLPLSDTLTLLSSSESELARLEEELAGLESALPEKKAELEALESEIKPMETDKEGLERFASEAVRMRDSARAEGKVDRENMGRWYKSVFEGLELLLQTR